MVETLASLRATRARCPRSAWRGRCLRSSLPRFCTLLYFHVPPHQERKLAERRSGPHLQTPIYFSFQ